MVANSYPYDRDGYCVYCRIGQYKLHAEGCDYRRSVEQAQREPHIVDVTPEGGGYKKTETF